MVDEVACILEEVGFSDVRIDIKPEIRTIIADRFPGSGVEDFVASAMIRGKKVLNRLSVVI